MKSMGIVGLPDDGSVQKYWLAEDPRVDPMDANRQTLMSASITRVDTTIMEFAKYLREDGEYEIFPSGENTVLYALSGDPTLGYHSTGEGSFITLLRALPIYHTITLQNWDDCAACRAKFSLPKIRSGARILNFWQSKNLVSSQNLHR